jgi:hypothetical protein
MITYLKMLHDMLQSTNGCWVLLFSHQPIFFPGGRWVEAGYHVVQADLKLVTCSPDWLQTNGPPALTSEVLRLHYHTQPPEYEPHQTRKVLFVCGVGD